MNKTSSNSTSSNRASWNMVVLRGILSSEPIERTLGSGMNVMQWDVTTKADGVTRVVPVQWDDPPEPILDFDEGEEVVVVGEVRRRFFRVGGSTMSRTEVLAHHAARPRQKVAVRRMLDRTMTQLMG